jgi:hypothetical protein
MQGYAEYTIFTEYQCGLYRRAVDLVDRLPTDKTLRCHELARAVGRKLDLEVVDGHYGIVEHTWLMAPKLYRRIYDSTDCAILDVYTPGQMPVVQLIDAWTVLPESRIYVEGDERDDIDEGKVYSILALWHDQQVAIPA